MGEIRRFWVGLAVLAIAGYCLLRAVVAWQSPSMLVDTDDVMRLVTAADLLGGQGYQDRVQHRDNVPFGAPMHWSRLVDFPVAGLLALGAPLGSAGAQKLAAVVWPTLLWVPLLAICLALSRRVAGPRATLAALLLPVVATPILIEFGPGRVDHHNVQMLLVGGLVLALMAGRRSVLAAGCAGLLAATSLAVGLETLPQVVVAGALTGLFVIADPKAARRVVVAFAGALVVGATAHFVLATAPAEYGAVWCDAFALPALSGAVAGAAALGLAAMVAPMMPRLPARAAMVVGVGVAAVAAVAGLFPQCLAGPYGGMDARLVQDMFPVIEEARPWTERLAAAPAAALSIGAPVLAGLAVALWRGERTRGEAQHDWLVLLAFLAAAVAVMLLQIRGARMGAVVAVPAGAWLVTEAWLRFRARNTAWGAAGVVLGWLAFAGIAQLALVRPLEPWLPRVPERDQVSPAAWAACTDPAAYAALAGLPPARVGARSLLGAHVLLHTGHSVVSTGYHRNGEGEADLAAVFGGDDAAARAVVERRGLELVVTCPGMMAAPEREWLAPISAPGAALQVYRVVL